MKHHLHALTFITLILFAEVLNAQVTQLSNNTNIRYGVPLGNLGLMVDEHGALWKTDGTPVGTVIYTSKVVKDTGTDVAYLNNKIYFAGGTLSEGVELWVTDGTDGGTSLIKDIYPGAASSSPRSLYVFNNTIYFFATTAEAGAELWKSDGTTGGTVMVKDIASGDVGSFDDSYTHFVANNNTLFFDANDGTHGTELWKTDGTSGGTVMIEDINPGAGSSNCQELTPLGNNVIFSADDGTHGVELWKSDGSTAGTQLIQDIVSGTKGSYPQQFVSFQNKLFFATQIGTQANYKLQSTDGTSVTLVESFGAPSLLILSFSVIMDNKLLFSAYTNDRGLELWSSDGTTGGTKIFMDINPGQASANAIVLPDILGAGYAYTDYHTRLYQGSKIFFVADDGTHGTELWITDGTVANTKMVTDLNPGTGSSMEDLLPWIYTTTDFYFGATDGSTGYELFKTDGTGSNTSLVKDINAGPQGSDPSILMFVNGHIYFTADDGDNENGDRDLYILDAEVSLPVTLLNFTAAANGKTVELNWSTANETNTKNFVVQRSYDGVHFDNIGSVNAAGNSTRQLNYHYIDASAFNGGNKIYYRLQIVDNDGRFSYSNTALVTILSNGNVVLVYPNPVKDQLIVVAGSTISKAEIRITDQSGKLVYRQQFENVQGGALNKINVAALSKGVYYLQFITDGDKQTTKFIKQ